MQTRLLSFNLILQIVFVIYISNDSIAAITCPPMPMSVTGVNRDIKSDIRASAASLGKVKAGEVATKTEVTVKNLFDKYPNVDKLVALQTMSATYCAMLRDATTLSEKEKLDRWERFQDKVLNIQPGVTLKKQPHDVTKSTTGKQKNKNPKRATSENKRLGENSARNELPSETLQLISDLTPKVDFKYDKSESGQLKGYNNTNQIYHHLSNVGQYPIEVTDYKIIITSKEIKDDLGTRQNLIKNVDYMLQDDFKFSGLLPPGSSKPYSIKITFNQSTYDNYKTVYVTQFVYFRTQQLLIDKVRNYSKGSFGDKELTSLLSGRIRSSTSIDLIRSNSSDGSINSKETKPQEPASRTYARQQVERWRKEIQSFANRGGGFDRHEFMKSATYTEMYPFLSADAMKELNKVEVTVVVDGPQVMIDTPALMALYEELDRIAAK